MISINPGDIALPCFTPIAFTACFPPRPSLERSEKHINGNAWLVIVHGKHLRGFPIGGWGCVQINPVEPSRCLQHSLL